MEILAILALVGILALAFKILITDDDNRHRVGSPHFDAEDNFSSNPSTYADAESDLEVYREDLTAAERKEWRENSLIDESFRLPNPTFITMWDGASDDYGVCVPEKHPAGKRINVWVTRKDKTTVHMEVVTLLNVLADIDGEKRWLSICGIVKDLSDPRDPRDSRDWQTGPASEAQIAYASDLLDQRGRSREILRLKRMTKGEVSDLIERLKREDDRE